MSDLIEKPKKKRGSGTNPDYDKPTDYDEFMERTLLALEKIIRYFSVSITSTSSKLTPSQKVGFSLGLSRHINDYMTISGKATSISLNATVKTQKGASLTAKEMRAKLLLTPDKDILAELQPRAVEDIIDVEPIESKPAEPVPEPVAPVEKKEDQVAFAHFDEDTRRVSALSIEKRSKAQTA